MRSEVLERLCDDLIAAGVHGLTPLGSTGEFAYLSWPQKKRIVEVVVKAARKRVPVVAGVASTTTADAVFQARVMLIGGVGWMAGPSCVVPRQSVELYALCRRKDWDGAMRLQQDLWNLNEAFAKHNLAACIKGGLELQGYAVGGPLPPQAPLSAKGVEEVRRALAAAGAL